MNLGILSVNIGRVRAIGGPEDDPVLSGIGKAPVVRDVFVRRLGIEGDEQADLTVHGGFDKAVYGYPSEHWPWWMCETNLACAPATFGENLTLQGAVESDVAIGDRFRWGDALLEVSQPRAPCYKLAIHTGHADAPRAMTLSTRCGWYFRVIEEGSAPSRATALACVARSGGPNVQQTFRALFDRDAGENTLSLIHSATALAESWRRPLADKIARLRAK